MPTERSSGMKSSGEIKLNGTDSKAAYTGKNIGKEFLGHSGGSESTSMGNLYRSVSGNTASGGKVPNSDSNTSEGLPQSGALAMSDFYHTSNAVDPGDFITETIYGRNNLSGNTANGGAGGMAGRGASGGSEWVGTQESNEVFYSGHTMYSNSVYLVNTVGWDMGIFVTKTTSGGKGGGGSLTDLYYSWMVRPHTNSSIFYDTSGNATTKNTSTWTEIWRTSFGATPWVSGGSQLSDNFKFAASHFRFTYKLTGTGTPSGAVSNTFSTNNSGFSTNSGATTNYYMPPLLETSNTVYTVGDGDGHYSSTTADDWTIGDIFRGARLTNTMISSCNNATSTRYLSMNCAWQDPWNSTQGSGANTDTVNAGYHTFTSPTFTFKMYQDNNLSGSCGGFICLHYDMLVNEKDKGIIHVHQVEVGDIIEWGEDWTKVTNVLTEHMREGYYLVDGWLKITNDHPILINDEWFTADQDDFPLDKEYFEGDVPTVYIETESGEFITYDADDNYITVSGDYAD